LASFQGTADQHISQLDAASSSLPADDPTTTPDESSLECAWAKAC
jgi:hypothetical protein